MFLSFCELNFSQKTPAILNLDPRTTVLVRKSHNAIKQRSKQANKQKKISDVVVEASISGTQEAKMERS